MASRALTPWLTREWLSHRNLHGATLPDTPTVETKRLQLVTVRPPPSLFPAPSSRTSLTSLHSARRPLASRTTWTTPSCGAR